MSDSLSTSADSFLPISTGGFFFPQNNSLLAGGLDQSAIDQASQQVLSQTQQQSPSFIQQLPYLVDVGLPNILAASHPQSSYYGSSQQLLTGNYAAPGYTQTFSSPGTPYYSGQPVQGVGIGLIQNSILGERIFGIPIWMLLLGLFLLYIFRRK